MLLLLALGLLAVTPIIARYSLKKDRSKWGLCILSWVTLLLGSIFLVISVTSLSEGRAWSDNPNIPEIVRVIQAVQFEAGDEQSYVLVNNGMDSGCEPRLIRTRLEGTSLVPGDLIAVKDGKVKVVDHEAELSVPKVSQAEASE